MAKKMIKTDHTLHDFLVIESFEVFYICLLEFQLIRKDDREKAENTY